MVWIGHGFKDSMRKLFCLLCLLSPLGEVWADVTLELEQGFRQPPAVAKPQVWWHWMNGNVTREGITADLEAMAEAGIGWVTIFNLAGMASERD